MWYNPESEKTEIFFTDLLQSGTTHWFRLFNWANPSLKAKKGFKFLVFEAMSLDDYPELRLRKNQHCILNLGPNSIERAMGNLIKYHNLNMEFDDTTRLIMDISIKRTSKKSVEINDLKVFELLGKDDFRNVLVIRNNKLIK